MRTIRGPAWARTKVRRWVLSAELNVIVPIVIVVHMPMLVYLGRKPGSWLADAWQVSGVMVGLVVTLVIFLLQSAAEQSLRSEKTFRAILRRTGVLWPVTAAIVFIALTTVVERFAGETPASSFAESYSAALVVVQVTLFGVAFLRAIRIVSPQGVARELANQFRDGVVVAVEASFAQRIASARMLEACKAHNVSFGSFLARGWPLMPKRPGWVADIDLRLPHRLHKLQLDASTTITAQPGERVGPRSPLAVSDVRFGGRAEEVVQAAVRVRRWGAPPDSPIDVFNDAVDLARRALLDGSNVSQDLAVELLADCYTAFYDAHALYGVDY